MKEIVKRNWWRIALILIALGVMWYGEQSRPCPAFGGEDLIGLLCFIAALRPEEEEEEEW